MTSPAERLRQKLLDLAIRGKLVKQDVHDEPAAELLKRIRRIRNEELGIRNGRARRPATAAPIEDDEKPFDLPTGWAWCRGGEMLIETETKLPKGKCFDYIDIDAIDNKRHRVISAKHIPVEDAPSRASRGLAVGDTLFSLVRPYLENIAYISEQHKDCIASTGFFVCRSGGVIEPEFLFLLMTSPYVIAGLNASMKGDNSPSIRRGDVLNFVFPLPPLAEQKRIVAALDAMLKEVDAVASGMAKLAELKGKARAKILDLAIRGKLVRQDAHDEPAAELLKRIQAEKKKLIAAKKIRKEKPLPPIADDEKPFDLPNGWAWCRLRELGVFFGGHTPSKGNSKLWGGNVLWVTSKDMKSKYIDDTGTKISKLGAAELTMLKPGTIIMCTRSGILRRTFPVAIAAKNLTINQDQRALSLFMPEMAEYVYTMLRSLETSILDSYRKTGTTVESIIFEKFIDMPIPLPPLAEQKRIVEKVEKMLAACEALAGGGDGA